MTLPERVSAERMWLTDRLYNVVVPLGWNDAPAIRGRGSAIFLHIAASDGTPTEGCIAVSPATMRKVLGMAMTHILVPG